MNPIRLGLSGSFAVFALAGLYAIATFGAYSSAITDGVTIAAGFAVYLAWAGDFHLRRNRPNLEAGWFWFALALCSLRVVLFASRTGVNQVGGPATLLSSMLISYFVLVSVLHGDISKRLPHWFWLTADSLVAGFFLLLALKAADSPQLLTYFIQAGSFVYDEISLTGAVFLLVAFLVLVKLKGIEKAPAYLVVSMVLFDIASCITNNVSISWVSPYMNIQSVLWESLLIAPALFCGLTYRFRWKPVLATQALFFLCFELVFPAIVHATGLSLLTVYITAEPVLMLACLATSLRILGDRT